MGKRNFRLPILFTAEEKKAILDTVKMLSNEVKNIRITPTELVRHGASFLSGSNSNSMPQPIKDHIKKLCWDTLKLEIFGVDKKTWNILAKIFGGPKKES